jgi:DNA (cytosine-5)-methyltransferase 1
MKSKLFSYISLFSGAGIGCFGFKQEEFRCIATVELLEKRLKFQRYNEKCFFDAGYISGDLAQESVKQQVLNAVKIWGRISGRNDLDVLLATPPCQGMSVANHKKGNEKSRNSLVIESIRLTNELRPKFFILENVRSFLTTLCTDIDGKEKKIKEAIEVALAGLYHIHYQTLNFKDYGNPSSRTRTLVVGTRKDLCNITPYNILPDKQNEITVRKAIGDLASLSTMGEINPHDIYHQFRSYSTHMLGWICDLKEGQSAFENKDIHKIPHTKKDGVFLYNANKNGDKYRRWYWDKVGPCIHTRNDIFASQSTIHPKDNRVFSIRELMRLMSIPDSFKWSDIPEHTLNKLSVEDKRAFLAKEEMNIRHSIGEAVPTVVLRQIASKIKRNLTEHSYSITDLKKTIIENSLFDQQKLASYIKLNTNKFNYPFLAHVAELANSQKNENAAYYTRQDICYSIIKDLPQAEKFKTLRILEPSIGVGNFLPLLVEKYKSVPDVVIDVVDIDSNSLSTFSILLKALSLPRNFKINLICDDFLLHNFDSKYDIVIGNPPFKKLVNMKDLLQSYKFNAYNTETNNIFAFFVEKALKLGDVVALVVPKSLLSSPEFGLTRQLLSKYNFRKIVDYGEEAFQGVLIETISFILNTAQKADKSNTVEVESYIHKSVSIKKQNYIFSPNFPYWLIYRDAFFDNICKTLKFDIFNAFRDRQITKKITRSSGKFRVLKSRNIASNEIINIAGYDCYVDDIIGLAAAKYLNNKTAVLVPNLTYNPRACFLPGNCITDGSVAILTTKNGSRRITKADIEFYGSDEFRNFYMITRNHGSRSLNIDNNSVFFFGIKK